MLILGRWAGTAGVITGGLNTAGKRFGGIGVEAADIVALPAMQGNRNVFQLGNGEHLCAHAQDEALCVCPVRTYIFVFC